MFVMRFSFLRSATRNWFKFGYGSSRSVLTIGKSFKSQEKAVLSSFVKSVLCVSVAFLVGIADESECKSSIREGHNVSFEKQPVITNLSGTHGCVPNKVYEPKNAQEVCRVLRMAHEINEHVRPVGAVTSPNGIAMPSPEKNNLLSVAAIKHIDVDTSRNLVNVGAGARVSDVLKQLNKHGLTLDILSSFQEQQIGGWTQVSAHGTGCTLSTADDMIVRMKLATPTEGLLTLSDTENPRLFSMAKVGLGSLGVVTELTLKCVPKFNLKETTAAIEMHSISEGHAGRLVDNRHVRYMWLPYTSTVVSVTANPTTEDGQTTENRRTRGATAAEIVATHSSTKAMVDMLLQLQPLYDRNKAATLSVPQLRELLLSHAPLSTEHVKEVNQAEAQCWAEYAQSVNAVCVGDSAHILSTADNCADAGGSNGGGRQQLVYEVSLPIGTMKALKSSARKDGREITRDLTFVKRLLKIADKNQLPLHCPIEQTWSAASTAPLSPAFSPTRHTVSTVPNTTTTTVVPTGNGPHISVSGGGNNGNGKVHSRDNEEVFSWVKMVMYLSHNQTEAQREQITREFYHMVELMQPLVREYNAHAHWASIELPPRSTPLIRSDIMQATAATENQKNTIEFLSKFFARDDDKHLNYHHKVLHMRSRVAERYNVAEFNQCRRRLDPKGVLSNDLINELFGNVATGMGATNGGNGDNGGKIVGNGRGVVVTTAGRK